MKRILLAVLVFMAFGLSAAAAKTKKTPDPVQTDREYWCQMCYRIARPVLEAMSRGELQKTMTVEVSPTWDGRDKRVAYLEAFGRLMAGISPWLALPDDDTPEGRMRRELRAWALQSYKNAVDPESPDCVLWEGPTQILVDAAYLAESFLRAPHATWEQLDDLTRKRYIERFKGLRTIRPAYNNWLLFRSMIEAFLLSVGEKADSYVLQVANCKIDEWYLSDGWYSDGPEFALDYYNSYVIHPMYIEVLETCNAHGFHTPIAPELAVRRMQRFNTLLERMISPEGAYPPVGRSVVYRMGTFQTLALAAWRYGLPENITDGQLRSALTAVMKRMYAVEGNFDEKDFLRIGFAGHQPEVSNYYTNNGSLYMTSLVFLPLGLPSDHPFWTAASAPWTSQKAWSGASFPLDGHQSVRR